MLTVELKGLRREAQAAAEYMASKTKTLVRTHGAALQLENVTAKDAKLLLHKFLHHRGLDGYRVVVVHSGLLEIIPPGHQTTHQGPKAKGSPPTAPVTMPYYFPGRASFQPSMKKSKRKRD